MKDLPNTDAYSFRFQEKQVLTKFPDSLSGQSFELEELTECEVSLLDFTSSLSITSCTNCTIRCGPCSGLVKVQHCTGCVLTVASSIFSITNSDEIIVFLYSSTEPVVKQCTRVTFGPYNLAYPGLRSHFITADLDPRKNYWSRVRCDDPNGFGVCWGLIQAQEFSPDVVELEGEEPPENPVLLPKEYGGTLTTKLVIGSQQGVREPDPIEEPEIIFPPAHQEIPLPQFSAAQDSRIDFIPPIPPSSSPSPSAPVSLTVITYDQDQGFVYAVGDPALAAYHMPQTTLQELSDLTVPHYQYIQMLQLAAYFLIVGCLILFLFIILLDQFVGLHRGGLAILLALLAVTLIALGVVIVLKWRKAVTACNTEMTTYTTARQSEYHSMKFEVQATLGQVALKLL